MGGISVAAALAATPATSELFLLMRGSIEPGSAPDSGGHYSHREADNCGSLWNRSQFVVPIRHDGVAPVDNASKPPLLHEDVTEHQVAMEESRARLVRSSDVVADLGCIKCDGSTDLLAASKGFGGHQVYGAATSAVGARTPGLSAMQRIAARSPAYARRQ